MAAFLLSESQEQILVAKLLAFYQRQGRVVMYSKLAQETYTKFLSVRARNRYEGLVSGVPDMIVVLQSKVLFIEMKRAKHATTTPAQKAWIAALDGIPNVYARVCHGYDEAKAFLDFHIS